MGDNTRHIARGIEAVIDSAYIATPHDVWVDEEDIQKAVQQVYELSNDPLYKPEIYAPEKGSSTPGVCLRL